MRGRQTSNRNWNVDVEEFKLNLINETDGAILVELDDGGEQWLPKKALRTYADNEDGTCTFEISAQNALEFNLV